MTSLRNDFACNISHWGDIHKLVLYKAEFQDFIKPPEIREVQTAACLCVLDSTTSVLVDAKHKWFSLWKFGWAGEWGIQVDSRWNWLYGFTCHLGIAYSLDGRLRAFLDSLRLMTRLNIEFLFVEMDAKATMELIRTPNHPDIFILVYLPRKRLNIFPSRSILIWNILTL